MFLFSLISPKTKLSDLTSDGDGSLIAEVYSSMKVVIASPTSCRRSLLLYKINPNRSPSRILYIRPVAPQLFLITSKYALLLRARARAFPCSSSLRGAWKNSQNDPTIQLFRTAESFARIARIDATKRQRPVKSHLFLLDNLFSVPVLFPFSP